MYTVEYFIEKFKKISFDKFCETILTEDNKLCTLMWCGATEGNNGWTEHSEESQALVNLFNKYLYPILNYKDIYFEDDLVIDGILISKIDYYDVRICSLLNINYKTLKERIIQSLMKIQLIQNCNDMINISINAEEIEFVMID